MSDESPSDDLHVAGPAGRGRQGRQGSDGQQATQGRDGQQGQRVPQGRDPEEVLSQALRAIAGGARRETPAGQAGPTRPHGSRHPRFTAAQVCLIALIVGVSAGMVTGIVVLLVR